MGIEKSADVEWSGFTFFSVALCEMQHIEAFCNLETSKTPFIGLDRPLRFQKFEAPRSSRHSHMKWRGCHPYAPATFNHKRHAWYPVVFEAELTPGATVMIKSVKVSNDLVGN